MNRLSIVLLLGLTCLAVALMFYHPGGDVPTEPTAVTDRIEEARQGPRGELRSSASSLRQPVLRIDRQGAYTADIRVSIPDCDFVETSYGLVVTIPGRTSAPAPGSPSIDEVSTVLPGLDGYVARVEVIEASFTDIENVTVAPAASWTSVPLQDDLEHRELVAVEDPDIYNQDRFWPDEIVAVEELWMQTQKVTRITYRPLRYNPRAHTLRHYDEIKSRVVYVPEESMGHTRELVAGFASGATESGASTNDVCCGQRRVANLLPPMTGVAGDFEQRRAGAEVDAQFKVGITNEGIYRIFQSALLNAGMASNQLVGSQIRMYCATQEVSLFVSTAGTFTPSDFIVFYGRAFDGYYTETNVYWLGLGGVGQRMANRDASVIGGVPDVTSHCTIVHYDEDVLYRDIYRGADDSFDHWFSTILVNPASGGFGPTNFPLVTDHIVATNDARLEYTLHGLGDFVAIDPDHRFSIQVNGNALTTETFNGESTFSGRCDFVSTLLSEGFSTFRFDAQVLPGVSIDVIYLESFSLKYRRSLHSDGGTFGFCGPPGTNNYFMKGFSLNNVFTLDVTDPVRPVILDNATIALEPGGYTVHFGNTSTTTCQFYASTLGSFRTINSIEKVPFFRDFAATNNQADYILIATYPLRTNAYNLLKQRYLSGLTVAVAPLRDIYNEFSYGVTDASAIKQFLGYAFHHWADPLPKYVLLAGDGSYDPKDHLGFAVPDIVPIHLGPTPNQRTSLDSWYVAVNGADDVPDMALGRLPVQTDTELGYLVDKMQVYEAQTVALTNSWRTRALAVADDGDAFGNDFIGTSDTNVVPYLSSYALTKAYLGAPLNAALVRATINGQINSGTFLVNYFGHGAVNLWADEDIYNNGDINGLGNTNFPLVTVFTCNNGYNVSPTNTSFVETFLVRQNRGAIACVAPAALATHPFSRILADGFYSSLDTNVSYHHRLGDVMLDGFNYLASQLGNVSELDFYGLYGDPALIINSTNSP